MLWCRPTDRALSCRPPVTLPWSTDGRPPCPLPMRAAGGWRASRTLGWRPVSSNALLSGVRCSDRETGSKLVAVQRGGFTADQPERNGRAVAIRCSVGNPSISVDGESEFLADRRLAIGVFDYREIMGYDVLVCPTGQHEQT